MVSAAVLYVLVLAALYGGRPCMCVKPFKAEVWDNINSQLEEHGRKTPKVITYDVNQWQQNNDHCPKMWEYEVPRIMFWDPITQYPILLKDSQFSIRCPTHGSTLKTGPWKSSKHNGPRWLYDRHGPNVLVMRAYTCCVFGDTFLSGESDITDQLPACIEVPFRWTHQAGFTTQLLNYILHSVTNGMHFQKMEEYFRSSALERYMCKQRQYCLDIEQWMLCNSANKRHDHRERFADEETFFRWYYPIPSDSYLKDIFLQSYRSGQSLYESHMRSLTAEYLSCNHTFKVSVNVGFQREGDSTWVKQYDSLFMVMNEIGQVLGYKLVKSTAFDNIYPLLNDIRSSLQTETSEVKIISLDNCCHWRKKIIEIFPRAEVKLYLFHAVQRITKCIPMKNSFRKEINKNLSMVFRQRGDTGQERCQATANTNLLRSSFEKFVTKWRSVISNDGEVVFSNETLKACSNLKSHIEKGCLSDIPVGVGTNRNERLHEALNKSVLAVGRIGAELAVAVLSVLLYKWNMTRKSNKGSYMPIWASFAMGHRAKPSKEHPLCCYSVPCKNKRQTAERCFIKDNTCATDDMTVPVIPVVEINAESNIALAQGIVNLHSSYIYMQKQRYLAHFSDDILWANNNCDMVLHCQGNISGAQEQLNTNVEDLNMVLHSVEPDGNCLFVSVAHSILFSTDRALRDHIESLGMHLNSTDDVQQFAHKLREKVVDEIQTSVEFYRHFTSSNKLKDIDKYYQSGTFEGELGDLLIAGISNVLGVTICIITGRADVKLIMQECRTVATSTQPCFLAYDHTDPGHYNAVRDARRIENSTEIDGENTNVTNIDSHMVRITQGCRCGCSQKTRSPDKKFCITARCPCLKGKISCNSACKCICCCSPFGSRPYYAENKASVLSRKRHKTHVTFKHRKCSKYIEEDLTEDLKSGGWTLAENMLIWRILKVYRKRNTQIPSYLTCMEKYNGIVRLVLALKKTFVMRTKTQIQIQHKIQHMKKKCEMYNTLMEI